MSGVSYGGLETMLTAETMSHVRGFIVFSGGARLWANAELQKRLYSAARNAKSPIFLIQAANDYSTAPFDHLGPILRTKEAPNAAKLYPEFGKTHDVAMGHIAFATWNLGTEVWGEDVLRFITSALRRDGPH